MAGLTVPTSKTFVGQYNTNWFSLNDIKMPDIQKATVKKYGKAFELFELTQMMGNVIDFQNDIKYIYEQLAIDKLITVDSSGIAHTAAGADITFTQALTDFDSGAVTGNNYLRPNDIILIPKQYLQNTTTIDAPYQVVSINASTGLVTARPFNNNATASAIFTQTELISGGVPAGTALAVVGNAFARGSSSPKGHTVQWFKRQYRTQISREAFDIEGGNESELWINISLSPEGVPVPFGTPGARNGFIMLGQEVLEHNINKTINYSLLMGNLNDNTALVNNNSTGASSAVLSTQGLIPTMALLAQNAPYTGRFDASNLDDIIPLLISQGLVNEHMLWLMGDLLYADFENACKNEIKEFGNDPIMTSMHDVGLVFKSLQRQGVIFNARVMSNLSNPALLGAAAYNNYYRKLGMMIPMNSNEVRLGDADAKNTKIGSLTLGFKNKNGENRRRVFGIVNGMTGHQGYPILNDVDALKGYALTEFGLIATKVNQYVLQTGV